MAKPLVLIIDDDPTFSLMLKSFLLKKDFDVTETYNAAGAIKAVKEQKFDIILTDFRLPDKDGLQILREIRQIEPYVPVILMTSYVDIRIAVQAIKLGAFEYVTKPINPDEILMQMRNALKKKEASRNPSRMPVLSEFDYVEGVSSWSKEINEYVNLVAPTNMSVIVEGESGTGKEYVSRMIHLKSKRRDKVFVPIDCGALSRDLAASELFGHLKGSFTGAINDKMGQFEAANGGTIFLDEIGNLSYDIQVKLLRALQERKVRKIGSNQDIDVDVRIIVATNEDLIKSVKAGHFREDLYHRLNEFRIQVKPIRERKEDIMVYAEHFLELANRELEKEIRGFSKEVVNKFLQYSWPGNLRELRNVVKRAVLVSNNDLVSPESLPDEIVNPSVFPEIAENNSTQPTDLKEFTGKQEKDIILNTLEKVGYNKSKAARILNIDRKTLYNKLKLYDLDI